MLQYVVNFRCLSNYLTSWGNIRNWIKNWLETSHNRLQGSSQCFWPLHRNFVEECRTFPECKCWNFGKYWIAFFQCSSIKSKWEDNITCPDGVYVVQLNCHSVLVWAIYSQSQHISDFRGCLETIIGLKIQIKSESHLLTKFQGWGVAALQAATAFYVAVAVAKLHLLSSVAELSFQLLHQEKAKLLWDMTFSIQCHHLPPPQATHIWNCWNWW